LPVFKHDHVKINAWCAAPYDGLMYRALIKSSILFHNFSEA